MWPALECGEGSRSRPSRPAEWAPQGASTWLPAHLGQGLPALDSGAPGRPMEAVRFQSWSPRPLKATLHSSPARAPHGALHAAPGSKETGSQQAQEAVQALKCACARAVLVAASVVITSKRNNAHSVLSVFTTRPKAEAQDQVRSEAAF